MSAGQIWARLKLFFAHGRAVRIGDDLIQAQVLDGETLDNIKRVEPYGFSYRAKVGAQAYLLFPGGDRSYGVAIVIGDRQYQMTLEEGEVALHDDEENYVHIMRGGVVRTKANTRAEVEAPLVLVKAAEKIRFETQRLEVTGDIVDRCDSAAPRSMSDMRTAHIGHSHRENGAGSDTDPPTQEI